MQTVTKKKNILVSSLDAKGIVYPSGKMQVFVIFRIFYLFIYLFFTNISSVVPQASLRSAQHSVREFDRLLTYHLCAEASPKTSAVCSVSPLNKSVLIRTLYFYSVPYKYRHIGSVTPWNSQQLSQVGLLEIASLWPSTLSGFSQTLLFKRPVLL